ncbi:hypothetical protein JCM21714_1630 [Gracilibacillus boraciitolerans JCM 21714]|uniref:Type IV pilus biogenesis protein PilN n=1 Tax=Gracilibacillus boraciitolerans JCM 21714 TaxID=1298598 RepID=W4VHE1_9BACI|nr:hypothetical protein [Gracilibacillus boraciitolerans]GAE92622.1 hypothetical protein JCM21714_1630 [Gracilibacillus boraciitolerans JCM 21714]
MIDINFFEKEKKNIAPYLLIMVFLLGIIIVSLISYLFLNQIIQQKEANLAKIESQSELVDDYQSVQLLQNQVNELESQISQIEEGKYPTTYLYNYIQNTLLPNTKMIEYQFLLQEELYIRVHVTDLDQIAEIQRLFVDTAFFEQVDLNVIRLIDTDQKIYESELTISVARDQLNEVTRNAN